MRTLVMLLVTLFFGAPTLAQSLAAAPSASGVEIDNVWLRADSPSGGNVLLSDTHDLIRNPSPRFEASFDVHNRGVKPIKAITFDYVFLDWDKRTELKRLPQRLKARIGAGESFGFRKRHGGRMRSGNYLVEIKRVEYADGSVWMR